MNILTFSDTHGQHRRIPQNWMPQADILAFGGDLTNFGNVEEALDFLTWFSELPYANKLFIAGNHDFCFDRTDYKYPKMERILQQFKTEHPDIYYLCDDEIIIDGIKFYGSPWQPWVDGRAFNLKTEEIRAKWEMIPKDVDVLITHGPVAGILDEGWRGSEGCTELKEVIKTLPSLKLHICGHIHQGYGTKVEGSVAYINASTMDAKGNVVNKPIIVKGIENEDGGKLVK